MQFLSPTSCRLYLVLIGLMAASPCPLWAQTPSLDLWEGPDGTVLLQGVLPKTSHEALVAKIRECVGEKGRMVDSLEASDEPPPYWESRVLGSLKTLIKDVDDLSLKIKENLVSVKGLVSDKNKSKVAALIKTQFPESEYLLTSDINSREDIEADRAARMKLTGRLEGKEGLEGLRFFASKLKIEFESSSARLSDAAKEELSLLAAAVKQVEEPFSLLVVGILENKGKPQANEWWRDTRSKTVRGYLKARGVPDPCLRTVKGEEIAPRAKVVGTGEIAEEENLRRVEFRVTEPDERALAHFNREPPKPKLSAAQLIRDLMADKLREGATAEQLRDFVNELAVEFESGKYRLESDHKIVLNALTQGLARFPDNHESVIIVGFNDTKGAKGANDWYRNTRCSAVRKFLRSSGVKEERLQVVQGDVSKSKEPAGRRVMFRLGDASDILLGGSTAIPAATGDPNEIKEKLLEEHFNGKENSAGLTALAKAASVEFAAGGWKLTPHTKVVLEALAEAAAKVPTSVLDKLVVLGFLDEGGSNGTNDWYREVRCKTVVGELERLGVEPDRIMVQHAEEVDIEPSGTNLRRVEFRYGIPPEKVRPPALETAPEP